MILLRNLKKIVHRKIRSSAVRRLSLLLFVTAVMLGTLSQSCLLTRTETNQTITVPAGWFLSWHNSGVALMKAEEKKPTYSLLFDRTNDVKDAEYYLRVAEAIYPDRSKIYPKRNSTKQENAEITSWYFERLWWFEEHKHYRVPYALTGDAVNYYIRMYKAFKSRSQMAAIKDSSKTGIQNRVEFAYSAKIIKSGAESSTTTEAGDSNFAQPVKVILKMRWFEYCGEPCGWGFEKTREVYFSSKTSVTRITGDGRVNKWKSEKSKPFQDDQWITF